MIAVEIASELLKPILVEHFPVTERANRIDFDGFPSVTVGELVGITCSCGWTDRLSTPFQLPKQWAAHVAERCGRA